MLSCVMNCQLTQPDIYTVGPKSVFPLFYFLLLLSPIGPWWPAETYDIAWSTEFLEHLGRQHMGNYMSTLKQAAFVFFSGELGILCEYNVFRLQLFVELLIG